MDHTPDSWRHCRIVEADGKFSLLSYYVRMRYGPLALVALGFDKDTKTEGLDLAAALALGAKLEKALKDNHEARRGKPKREK